MKVHTGTQQVVLFTVRRHKGVKRVQRRIPTTEHIWADIGRAPTLVLQQVILAHQVLPQAEVGDGDPVSPGEKHKVSGNTGILHRPCSRQQVDSRTGAVPVGLSGELEVLGEDTQRCKMSSIPKGRDSMTASKACKELTGAVKGSVTAVTTSGSPVSARL